MKENKVSKVSVCLVTYNQENYIRECLQSIVDQVTDFDFEIIVGDDGSTDGTQSIVREFSERYPDMVKPIFREKNMGALKNFILTHNFASSIYVANCDGDDIFLPDKLQKQFNYLEKHQGCNVVWHRVNFFDDEGGFFSGKAYDYSMFDGGIVTFEKAIRLGSVATNSSAMYRKSARKTNNPDFDVIDLFYSLEYLSSGFGMILDDVLGEYRVNAINALTTSSGSRIKTLYARHANYYFSLYPKMRRNIFLFAITNFFLDLKNRRKSVLDFLFLALKTFTLVSPMEVICHLQDVHKLKIPKLTRSP